MSTQTSVSSVLLINNYPQRNSYHNNIVFPLLTHPDPGIACVGPTQRDGLRLGM